MTSGPPWWPVTGRRDGLGTSTITPAVTYANLTSRPQRTQDDDPPVRSNHEVRSPARPSTGRSPEVGDVQYAAEFTDSRRPSSQRQLSACPPLRASVTSPAAGRTDVCQTNGAEHSERFASPSRCAAGWMTSVNGISCPRVTSRHRPTSGLGRPCKRSTVPSSWQMPILVPRRELPRDQPATGRTNHDAPNRYAVPAVCLVPVGPGAARHHGQALRPRAHCVRGCGAVALPCGLAALEKRTNPRSSSATTQRSRRNRTRQGASSTFTTRRSRCTWSATRRRTLARP